MSQLANTADIDTIGSLLPFSIDYCWRASPGRQRQYLVDGNSVGIYSPPEQQIFRYGGLLVELKQSQRYSSRDYCEGYEAHLATDCTVELTRWGFITHRHSLTWCADLQLRFPPEMPGQLLIMYRRCDYYGLPEFWQVDTIPCK